MVRVRGAKLIVRALEDEGVRHTFGIPGTHNIELYDALASSRQVEPILVTSELAAGFMADGVSRTSEHIGVLVLVPGAGVTHALSGIAEAYLDTVPLVAIVCGIRSDTDHAFQLHAIDQLRVLAPVTKAALRVEKAGDVYPQLRRAFQVARSDPAGPVAVEIPADLVMLTHTAPEPWWEPGPRLASAPDPDLVAEAARLLNNAERPALYVGAGAARACHHMIQVAERLGAPVATTTQGKGVFPESHPLWLWCGSGAHTPSFVRDIMGRCDCLLAVGCRFSEVATGSYGMEVCDRLIHVDADARVLNRNHMATLAIQADAGAFLAAVSRQVVGSGSRAALEAEIARGHDEVQARWQRERSRQHVDPHALFVALQRHCRPDTVFATDSGNGTFLAMEHLRLERPGCFVAPVDFSAMGYAVPAALGAAIASPGREVVALPGDGALLMTGLELVTASALRVAPLVVVLRDGQLGQIAHFQDLALNRATCTTLPAYRVADLARTAGCRYFRVVRDHELDSVLPAAIAMTRERTPVVVEVSIDPAYRTYFTKGVVKTNFWRLPWRDRWRMLGRALLRRF